MSLILTEEERKLLATRAPKRGPEKLTDAERRAMTGEDLAPATTTQNVRQALGGPVQGAADLVDMPFYLREMAKAADPYVPDLPDEKDGLVGSVVSSMRNALVPSYFPDVMTGKAKTSELPGLKQAKEALAPEYENAAPWAEAARTFGIWAGPGTGARVIREGVKGGVKALPRAFKNSRADIITGAGAAGGQGAGELLNDESGSATGELIGGLTGLIYALKTGKMEGLTRAQEEVLRALDSQYDDRAQALADLENRMAEGEIGTLGDLTRSQGVMDIENMLGRNAVTRRNLARTSAAREQQIYDDTLEPLGTGDASTAPYATNQAINQERRSSQEATSRVLNDLESTAGVERAGLERSRKAAEDVLTDSQRAAQLAEDNLITASGAADPRRTTVEASESAMSRLDRAKKIFQKRTRLPAWRKFEAGPVDTASVQLDQEAFASGLRPKQAEDLQSTYGTLLDDLRSLDSNATAKDVQGVIADMKKAANAPNPANPRAQMLLTDLYKQLENNLADVNPAYRRAVAASKEEYERFGGRVGDAMGSAEPEAALSGLGARGDMGAATTRQIGAAKVPTADRDLFDFVLAEAVKKGDNISDEFLAQYQGAINRMPPADKAKLEGLVSARAGRDSALKQATAAERTAERATRTTERQSTALEKSLRREQDQVTRTSEKQQEALTTNTRGRFAEDPDGVIDTLLRKTNGEQGLRELMDSMTDLRQVDSFKARVKDRLSEMLFEAPAGVASKGNAYKEFLKIKDRMVNSGVLTQADAARMEKALERTNSLGLRQAARANDITQKVGRHIGYLSSAGAAALLGPMPGAYSLMIGGAIRRGLNEVLSMKVTNKRLMALDDYLNDPAKYLDDVKKAKTPEEAERLLLVQLVGASQAAAIMGDTE